MLLSPPTSRRPSSTFLSAPGTPSLGSRRSSYTQDGEHHERLVPNTTTSKLVPEVILETAASALTPPILDLAKMRNPTIALRFGTRFDVELTYAALLQYLSMLLCVPRTSQLLWVPTSVSDVTIGTRAGSLRVLNAVILSLAVGTVEMRQKSEKLGLRRTSLLLCTVLFCLAILVAMWPASSLRTSARDMHQCNAHPLKESPASQLAIREMGERQHGIVQRIRKLHAADVDALCKYDEGHANVIQIDTPDDNFIRIQCR